MPARNITSRDEWLKARLELLKREKAHSRARDELTHARQELPWVKLDKEYMFAGAGGPVSLSELFQDKSQLIIYHFMYDPDWDEGCKSCSFIADHYDPSIVHLNHRDVAFVTVSIASLAVLDDYKKRMGWSFEWVSSANTDFNRDFNVSFTEEELKSGVNYNYRDPTPFPLKEAPGISVFAKDRGGQVYHTYSSYGRGLENFMGAYSYLDLVPKGRDEGNLAYGMEWLRHKDRYESEISESSCCKE